MSEHRRKPPQSPRHPLMLHRRFPQPTGEVRIVAGVRTPACRLREPRVIFVVADGLHGAKFAGPPCLGQLGAISASFTQAVLPCPIRRRKKRPARA